MRTRKQLKTRVRQKPRKFVIGGGETTRKKRWTAGGRGWGRVQFGVGEKKDGKTVKI